MVYSQRTVIFSPGMLLFVGQYRSFVNEMLLKGGMDFFPAYMGLILK